MPKLLWVGDAACGTGFARSTHGVLDVLRETYDVTVLGMNYRGDPHNYPYDIYVALAGGDAMGVLRLPWMIDKMNPDLIVIQNDPWNIPAYFRMMRPMKLKIPVVGFIALDGKNCQGEHLKDLSMAIFWTKFAEQEAKLGGYTGPTAVVPLGVDLNIFKPGSQSEARSRVLPEQLREGFFVVNVNRNQVRKRLDLTIEYFAEWVHSCKIDDAFLWLHVAPTGDSDGCDCKQLARYYGLKGRVVLSVPEQWYGIEDEDVADTYRLGDVVLTTTQGEGFGLTTFEAMACGIPVVAPDWSALGELCRDGAWLVSCSSHAVTSGGINVVGGIPDKNETIEALDMLYRDAALRREYTSRGRAIVEQPQYRWRAVGEAFRDALVGVQDLVEV